MPKKRSKQKKQKDAMKPWSIRLPDKTIEGLKDVKDEKIREALTGLVKENNAGKTDLLEEYEEYDVKIRTMKDELDDLINRLCIKLNKKPLVAFEGKKLESVKKEIHDILSGEKTSDKFDAVPRMMKYKKLNTELEAALKIQKNIRDQMEKELRK